MAGTYKLTPNPPLPQPRHHVPHRPGYQHRRPAGPRLRIPGLGEHHGHRFRDLRGWPAAQHVVGDTAGDHVGGSGGEPGVG